MTPLDLSRNASIPIELARMVFAQAKRAGIDVTLFRASGRRIKPQEIGTLPKRARAKGYSYWMIGRALNRDHSTVRYHVVGKAR